MVWEWNKDHATKSKRQEAAGGNGRVSCKRHDKRLRSFHNQQIDGYNVCGEEDSPRELLDAVEKWLKWSLKKYSGW